jgi:hypothetical protein
MTSGEQAPRRVSPSPGLVLSMPPILPVYLFARRAPVQGPTGAGGK